MKKIRVFVIQAFQVETPTGQLQDLVTLELIDTTFENALKRAKKLVKKKFYRLSMVIEKYEAI